jgi:hypothetical protein
VQEDVSLLKLETEEEQTDTMYLWLFPLDDEYFGKIPKYSDLSVQDAASHHFEPLRGAAHHEK